MRLVLTAVALVALGGCAPDALEVDLISTLEQETRGVVLYEDGQRAHAAMMDTTCEFDTLNGWRISEYDLPTSSEIIKDTYQGRVLATSVEAIHVVDPDTWTTSDVELQNVVEARFVNDGVVALQADFDGCTTEWADGSSVPMPDSACDSGVAVASARDGTLFVATESGLIAAHSDEYVTLDVAPDRLAWDNQTGILYSAQSGSSTVTAVDSEGTSLWEYELPGDVISIDDMGVRGNVIVLSEGTGETGDLSILNGYTGDLVARHWTPGANADVVVSGDGTTLAVVLTEQVFFYDVYAEGETRKTRQTFGTDPNQPVIVSE